MSDPANYTVGWICAIGVEYVAAQEFLDEEHEGPNFVSPNDTNDYTLGKMGQHNVVIAVLPDGEYGTASAASVATNLLNSFPNVRIGLMVGIGGGVPSKNHDIRLGDVVVSASRNGEGGVFQYDFGKSIQGQGFQHTRFLNQPPTTLRTAMTGIQAQYKRKGHRLEEAVNGIIERNARLRREYERPQSSTDRLFKAEIVHNSRCCAVFCADDLSKLVLRHERTEHDDNPTIHFGLIASADQLMKDALIRDRLAAEKDVLCFEMEAAGLMNHFPCLVIRGICDYSDSHKNKEWQGYASMVAAAYAKDLLRRISPNKIEAEKRIGDILSGLRDVAEEQRNIAQKQLVIQEDIAKQKWSDKEEECLQLFRLTSGTKDATYEWYKHHVEARVNGTCEWFLNHDNFQKWLSEDSGPLLVSADPGCGKSVLAKYLIDDRLPRSSTICYFFFKDQDQDTVRQALCALLHQLFSQRPFLIKHAMEEYRQNGRGIIKSTNSLWKILGKAVQDPQAGPVIIVLDALDECAESEFEDLIRRIESQFQSDYLGHSKLKYLLTCRPYEQIVCKFMGLVESFPFVHIPGEEESESISREVNHVIEYRVEQLGRQKRLSEPVKSHLAKKLLGIPHRTYLWVYLVFDLLMTEHFKKTPNGIDSTIACLPTNVHEAYEQILSKSKKDPMVRRALSIILAASRPLNLSEMNVALNVDSTSKSLHHLDLEEDEDFKLRLRTWCGLFVSIHHDKIYFLHQTAREFLLAHSPSPTPIQQELRWQHSITSQDARKLLAKVCVVYLDFLNNEIVPTDTRAEIDQILDQYTFLDYSAKSWGAHYLKACISTGADIVPSTLNICDPDLRSCSVWLTIYWESMYDTAIENFTSLTISSYFGLKTVVMVLLEKNDDVESKDNYGRTPLSWAARNGHEDIAKLLLEKGADVESKDNYGRTPLSWAARNGHEAIIKLLPEKGADVESKDKDYSRTPLSLAAQNGHEAIVKLLLDTGADVESKDDYGQTPLLFAAQNGHEAIVKLLLDKGADIESKDTYGRTPLNAATLNGHLNVVKLLLENGADVTIADNAGGTPIHNAAFNGHSHVASIFLQASRVVSNIETPTGRTPLYFAATSGHTQMIDLLLAHNASPYIKDRYESTAMFAAVRKGHEKAVKRLLEFQEGMEFEDGLGRSLFWWAKKSGNKNVVQLLLEFSQRTGILIPKAELDMDCVLVSSNRSTRYCDVCTLSILPDNSYYKCGFCADFDVCLECFEMAGRCLDHPNGLAFKTPDV